MSVTSLSLVHNIVAMYFLHNHETEIEIIYVEKDKKYVIHSGIKYKLLQNNINGMFYRMLCDMYKKNYLSVKLGSKLTQPFKSDIGI
jgi:hypothetical protein